MVVTEPLPPACGRQIGWDGCETLSDEAHAYMYAQRTADGRIAIGGRGVPYRFAFGDRPAGSHASRRRSPRSPGSLRRMFPAAADARIEHAWCGVLGVPRDWCASVTYDPRVRPGLGGRLHRGTGSPPPTWPAARSPTWWRESSRR